MDIMLWILIMGIALIWFKFNSCEVWDIKVEINKKEKLLAMLLLMTYFFANLNFLEYFTIDLKRYFGIFLPIIFGVFINALQNLVKAEVIKQNRYSEYATKLKLGKVAIIFFISLYYLLYLRILIWLVKL